VIAGQGTIGLEIAEDGAVPDVVLCAAGGGGLVSGVAVAVKARNPAARVIAVEPEGSDALHAGLEAGHSVPVTPKTAADALTGPFAGENCLAICKKHGVESVLVSEEELAEAFRFLYTRTKLACELGAAAPAAAILAGKAGVEPGQTVVAVVSGGNVATHQAAAILARR
jgi:threonine dehydratase